MNYIKEINAFYDQLELNDLSASAIALWHALMHINNKAGWAETFTVAASVLSVKSKLSERTISKARNELKQKGYIDFQSRKGNKAPIYKINSLTAIISDNHADKRSNSCTDNHADKRSTLLNLNENETENSSNSSKDERVGGMFKNLKSQFSIDYNSTPIEKVNSYLDDKMEPELINRAIKITKEKNKDLRYFWGILSNSYDKGILTLEAFIAAEKEYEIKKKNSNVVYVSDHNKQKDGDSNDRRNSGDSASGVSDSVISKLMG
ncbi:DnaD domain protein [Chengkuizengella marina]|uniref:DnaD domain protein n=1 Tax=Chengkuizengella marina TaxID=2507566 RepID=A0A6N9Q2U8_9BACL|nr:helix-turn-helix domain-containing protein [Chengkuizengella marina]NBI29113.1 DnaD domain protein [Chengkuizengella marina]